MITVVECVCVYGRGELMVLMKIISPGDQFEAINIENLGKCDRDKFRVLGYREGPKGELKCTYIKSMS